MIPIKKGNEKTFRDRGSGFFLSVNVLAGDSTKIKKGIWSFKIRR